MRGELPTLIPREVLFGYPSKTMPRLSPDGTRLAYLAPDQKGVQNVWVTSPGSPDAGALITHDQRRGIRQYRWAEDGHHILFLQDEDGNERWHLYVVDVASGRAEAWRAVPGSIAEVR